MSVRVKMLVLGSWLPLNMSQLCFDCFYGTMANQIIMAFTNYSTQTIQLISCEETVDLIITPCIKAASQTFHTDYALRFRDIAHG